LFLNLVSVGVFSGRKTERYFSVSGYIKRQGIRHFRKKLKAYFSFNLRDWKRLLKKINGIFAPFRTVKLEFENK